MKKLLLISTILVMLFPGHLHAQLATEQGVGQITYKGWGSPNAKARQEAILRAKLNALTRYSANFDQAKAINYEKIKATVQGDPDRFVTNYSIIDEAVDKKSKSLRVAIQATIDSRAIQLELQKISAIYGVAEQDKSYLTFVFVAREATSVKVFDEKRTTIITEDSSQENTETTIAEQGDLSFSTVNSKDVRTTTGGSTVQKADQIKWDVSNADTINTAMSKIFSTAGFEVIDAEYLTSETAGLVDVAHFIDDFKYGDDISGNTKRDAVAGCRDLEIQYLAIGTLDVGIKHKDPVSGMTKVFVSVTGKIMSLNGRFPKTVAAVGPLQFSGLGPNQTVSKNNALLLAAEKAASQLTAQLSAKGIK